jgi:hypothetical protein
MTRALVHVAASDLLGLASCGVNVVALQRAIIVEVLKHGIGDLDDVGRYIVAGLGNSHERKLAIRGPSVIAADIGAILSRVNPVDLSIKSVEVLGLEVEGLCNPGLNSRGAISVVPLTSKDKEVRGVRAVRSVSECSVIPRHVINHLVGIDCSGNSIR